MKSVHCHTAEEKAPSQHPGTLPGDPLVSGGLKGPDAEVARETDVQ